MSDYLKRQRMRAILAAAVTLVLLLIGYWAWLHFAYRRPYERIVVGDSEARVIELLGKPSRVSATQTTVLQTGDGKNTFGSPGKEVVKEFWYAVPILFGDEYVIGFDSTGHAILKNTLTSP